MKLFLIALVATLALTAACTGVTTDAGPRTDPTTVTQTAEAPAATTVAATETREPEPTSTPEPAETAAEDPCGGSLEGCFTYDEMDEYVDAVIPMVAQYFETAYEGVPAPRDIVYIPNGYSARSYCGVSTSEAYEYCTGDQTIYVGQDLIWAFYRHAGDAAPAVALAHEWGHHLQYMLDVPFARTQSQAIAFENQADCVSGAWASYADEQSWLETEDDVGDVETLLQLIGSRESRARDHGTSAERAEAFESGFDQGIESCNAYFPDSPIG
jgi:hypothetical protein